MSEQVVIDTIDQYFDESDGKTTEELVEKLTEFKEYCKEIIADLLS
jgi:hypothetical protein